MPAIRGGYRAPPSRPSPPRTPGGRTGTPNPNSGRAQGPSSPGQEIRAGSISRAVAALLIDSYVVSALVS